MLRVRDIETIVERGMCAGCGLCASIAGEHRVQMEMADTRYLRPLVHQVLDPPTLSKILDVYPGMVVRANEPGTVGPDSKESLMWGPWTTVHRAHAADPPTASPCSSRPRADTVIGTLAYWRPTRGFAPSSPPTPHNHCPTRANHQARTLLITHQQPPTNRPCAPRPASLKGGAAGAHL